jgi:ribose/xylose/arabinose/galactoside ABC-type transport system permease subunit
MSSDTAPVVLETRDHGRWIQLLQDYGIYGAIVLLILIDVILSPSFFSLSNLNVQLTQMVPTLLVALGMALVIGTEGIDLSVGAVIALAASVIPLYLGYGAVVAVLLALLSGVVAGIIAGAMVAFAKVQPIVATLSLMIGLRGIAVIIGGASAKPISDPTIGYLGTGKILGLPVMFWLAVVLVVIVAFVVRRTTFGRQLVAIGDNRRASTLAGLPVRRVLLAVYIISGLMAAIAGVILVGYGAESDPANYGLSYELMAITAVVVGGTPLSGGKIKVLGTVAGAFFMQLITASLVQRNVPTSYSQMVEAAIIIVAVYIARGRSSR